MIKMIKILMFVVMFCASGFVRGEIGHFVNPPKFNILVIYSANRSNEVCLSISNGIQNALLNRSVAYSLEAFELNSLYDRDKKHWDDLMQTYVPDIVNFQYDLIVAESKEACSTLMKCLDKVPQQTSVIFANISNFDFDAARKIHPNSTAIFRKFDVYPNIKCGLKLFPNTKEIILIVSSEDWNEKYEQKLKLLIPKGVQLNILHFDDDTPETLHNISHTLKNASKKSFLVSIDWDRFFANKASRIEIWRWLKKQYAGPIFVRRNVNLDYAIGGFQNRLYYVGALTGEFAERIASGAEAGKIVPKDSPITMAFNVREAARFGVKISDLPKDCELYNNYESWLSVHKATLLNSAFILVGALIVTLFFIAILIIRHRKSKFYSAIQESLPARVAVFDRDGHILYYHFESEMHDSMKANVKYENVQDLPWIKSQSLLNAIVSVYDTGTPYFMNYECYGEKRSVSFVKVSNKIFKKGVVVSVSLDSEELQNSREEAINSLKRLSDIFWIMADAVIATDIHENIIAINDAALSILGCTYDSAVGEKLADILKFENKYGVISRTNYGDEPIYKNANFEEYIGILKKNGILRRISIKPSQIKDSEGNRIGTVHVLRDITEIYEERDKFNTLVTMMTYATKYTNISFFRIDLRTGEIFPLLAGKLHFCPISNGKSLPLEDWVLAEDLEKFKKFLSNLKKNEIGYFNDVFRTEYSGVRQYLSVQATLHKCGDENDAIDEIVGICRDITADKIENERNQYYRFLQTEIENAFPYPLFLKNPSDNFRYIHCNKAFADKLGISISDVKGKTDYELFAMGCDADAFRENDRKMLQTGRRSEIVEQFHNGKGDIEEICVIRQPVNDGMRGSYILGISIDITKKESDKLAVKKAVDILSVISDAIPLDITVKNADDAFRYCIWNKSIQEHTGVLKENILGRNNIESAMSAETASAEELLDKAIMSEGEKKSFRRNFKYVGNNNTVCDVYRIPVSLSGSNFLFEMRADITEQLKMKSQLADIGRHSILINCVLTALLEEPVYEKAVKKMMEIVTKNMDADVGVIFRHENGKAKKEFEWSCDGSQLLDVYLESEVLSVVSRLRQNENIIISDTMNISKELLDCQESLLSRKIKSVIVSPIMCADVLYGSICFFNISKNRHFDDADGNCVRDVGRLFLITRNGELQRRTISDQTSLRSKIFETVEVPISLFDVNFRLISANSAFFRLFDRKTTENIGKICKDVCRIRNTKFCTPEYCPVFYTQTTGEPKTSSAPINGRIVQGRTTPIFDSFGNMQYILQTLSDITKISSENKNLSIRIEQDKLIKRCTDVLLLEPDLKKGFEVIVKNLSEFYKGISVRIMRSYEYPDGFSVDCVVSEISTNLVENIKKYSKFQEKRFPAIFGELRKGIVLKNNIYESLSESDSQWKHEMYERQKELGFRDVMLFPLMLNGKFWGYMDINRGDSEKRFIDFDEHIFNEAKHIIEIILERESMKQELELRQDMTSQLFEKISLPLVLIDVDKKIKAVNQTFCDFLHLSREEIINGGCRKCVCESTGVGDCEKINCPILRTIKTGEVCELDYKYENRIFRWRSQPIFDLDGKVKYALDCAFEVTDDVEYKKRLLAQRKSLDRINTVLQSYLEQDKRLSECLETVIFEDDTENARLKVLGQVVALIGADSCALMQFTDLGEDSYSTIKNICGERSSSLNMRFPYSDYKESFAALKSGETIHLTLDDTDSGIAWYGEIRAYLKAAGVSELVKIPLFINKKLWGYLGAEQKGKSSFSAVSMRLLERATHIIEVLLVRELSIKEAQKSELEKQIILDTIEFPLILLDSDMNILHANLASRKVIFGNITDWKAKPKACNWCRHKNSCNLNNKDLCIIKNAIISGKTQSDERKIESSTFQYSAVPIKNGNSVEKVLLSAIDITYSANKQNDILQTLKTSSEQINADGMLFATFTDILSKDISRIWNNIKESNLGDRKDFEMFREETNNVAENLGLLAKFARSTGGLMKFRRIPTDISKLIDDIVKSRSEVLSATNLKMKINIEPKLPKLAVDGDMLGNVIGSYVDSSIRYTRNGGILIDTSYSLVDKILIVKIRDTGIGIEAEKIKGLVSALEAGRNAKNINVEELRLLTNAEVLRAYGAKVEIQSKLGAGTCVTISIPAEIVKSELVTAIIQTNLIRDKILIVDDVMMNLKVLGSILKRLGYPVIEASSAKSALEIMKALSPLCILTDIWMPEMNGVEFASEIRKNAKFDRIPIIAITADAESERTFDMSIFSTVVIKPVTSVKMTEIMQKYVKI